MKIRSTWPPLSAAGRSGFCSYTPRNRRIPVLPRPSSRWMITGRFPLDKQGPKRSGRDLSRRPSSIHGYLHSAPQRGARFSFASTGPIPRCSGSWPRKPRRFFKTTPIAKGCPQRVAHESKGGQTPAGRNPGPKGGHRSTRTGAGHRIGHGGHGRRCLSGKGRADFDRGTLAGAERLI